MSGDFRLDAVQCRWQPLADQARAQDVARDWLSRIAGAETAAGLHRDPRRRPRLLHGDAGWSHSHGRLLLGYARDGRVGVDVEATGRAVDALRIAARYFAAEEAETLARLAEGPRRLAFLRLWCAKEAVLKAHGAGLAFGLHRVAFEIGDGALRMRHCDAALGAVADWTLHEFAPEPGFIAAVASAA